MRQESRVWLAQCMALLYLGLIVGAQSSTKSNVTPETTVSKAEHTTTIGHKQGIQTSSPSIDNGTSEDYVDEQTDRNNHSTVGFSSADATTLPADNTDRDERSQGNKSTLPAKYPTTHSASATLHNTSNRKEEGQSSSGALIAFFVIVFIMLIIISLVFVLKKKKKMSYSFDRSNKTSEASGIPLENVKA